MENTVGVFFRKKGITMYENEPHSIVNIVLSWSSYAIRTWLYPEKTFVNEYSLAHPHSLVPHL
jgi:hypothetical protein